MDGFRLGLLSLVLCLGGLPQTLRAVRNEDWKTDYHIRYKITDFLGKAKGGEGQAGGVQAQRPRVGLLDSGVSAAFSAQHPSIRTVDFTDENDPFDSSGHGTFSMSVFLEAVRRESD